MSKNIIIFLIDNNDKNKFTEEIEIQRPKTLEELQIKLQQKMKNFPDYYNLFYKSDNREINIQNNEQYHIFSNNILFIRKANPEENAGTIFKKSINASLLENKNEKNKIDDNDELNKLKKEIKEKEKIIEENNKYIEKTFLFFKTICEKLKKMHLLINTKINNLLENLIISSENEKKLKSYYEIMAVISEEMDTFQKYLINKLNINSINEDNTIENKKEKTKITYNKKSIFKKKKIYLILVFQE